MRMANTRARESCRPVNLFLSLFEKGGEIAYGVFLRIKGKMAPMQFPNY